jgi:hypothetical protein
MPLNAPQQLAKVGDLRRDDDASVRAPRAFPFVFEAYEVDDVEGEDGPAMRGCVDQLRLVRNALAAPAGFLTALRIVAESPERGARGAWTSSSV